MQKLITIKTDKTQVSSLIDNFKFKIDLRADSNSDQVQVLSLDGQSDYGNLKALVGIDAEQLINHLTIHPEQLEILEDENSEGDNKEEKQKEEKNVQEQEEDKNE